MATFKLLPARLQNAEYFRTRYAAAADAGTTREDLERPDFWSHVARTLKRQDIIEVIPEDESYFAELLVLNTGVGFAKVKVIRFIELEAVEESEDGLVIVKWRGPARKFSAVRKSDGTVLRDEFINREDAAAFARDYERTVNA